MRAYWLLPVLVATVFAVAVLDGESGLRTWLKLHQDLAESKSRIAVLESATERLRAEAEALQEDPLALERAIREDLDLARPGELVVRFAPGSNPRIH